MRNEKKKIEAGITVEREKLEVEQKVVISAIEGKVSSSHHSVVYQQNKGKLHEIMISFACWYF